MNRKLRLGLIGAAALLVIAAITYFAAVPAYQVNSYKKSEAKHKTVNDKMVRATDTFKLDIFTKSDTKAASDRIDIETARDAVKEANTALDTNEKDLTGFKSLPLLSWNKKYKAAAGTSANEQKYVTKAHAFLKDYTELLDYSEKQTALGEEIETANSDLTKMQTATSVDALTKAIDSATTKLETALNKDKQITPPDYLASYHSQGDQAAGDMIATLKELSSATRKLDLAKIESLSQKITDQSSALDKLSDKFITDLHKNSRVQLDIVELKLLNEQITKGYGQL